VVASTSPDLIAWSTPTLVMPASHPVTYQCGDADPINYPSLLDPASTSRNFETVGDRAYLYFTRWNTTNCRKTLDRDLVRVPVRILVPSG
jgi:hypothetical protein